MLLLNLMNIKQYANLSHFGISMRFSLYIIILKKKKQKKKSMP